MSGFGLVVNVVLFCLHSQRKTLSEANYMQDFLRKIRGFHISSDVTQSSSTPGALRNAVSEAYLVEKEFPSGKVKIGTSPGKHHLNTEADLVSVRSSANATKTGYLGEVVYKGLNRKNGKRLVRKTSDGSQVSMQKYKKYLIFKCSTGMCGGWSDRQRGLVNVYILSIVTGRQFGIIMTKPCNVTRYYVPKEVNWIIPDDELRGKTEVMINDKGSSNFSRDLSTMNFNKKYPQDVVYIKTNNNAYVELLRKNKLYASKLPQWAISTKAAVFAKAWNTLMRPSAQLQSHLKKYLRSISFEHRTRPLVCSHVRVARSETIPMDGKPRMNVSDIGVLWNFLDGYVRNGSKMFLATDSQLVRNMTRQRFGDNVTDTGGDIIHVDMQANLIGACNGFGYALLDQLIMTHCDVLVLSTSGFGLRAGFLRKKRDNLFIFRSRKVTPMKI